MQATHPLTMTTLSTHDTKRSDDVRARLAVLSEVAGKFGASAQRWSRMNNALRTNDLPDRNTEYFYYQTLIGAWPLTIDRAKAYMQKATREAKQQTSWVANNKNFEDALNSFIEGTFNSPAFIEKLEQFVGRISEAGQINSLTQTLLKYTAPGVPDLYQGSELWDLSLVDPDNRRPVNYKLRTELLKELEPLPVADAAALAMSRMAWFGAEAAYTRLNAEGKAASHVVAYLRGESVITIVPRLSLTMGDNWQKTTLTLPEGRWRNRLTDKIIDGGRVAIEALLNDFPVALLTREEAANA
jgi:(1->4)-alpha-D-glucan 1-alpha-D-glucosylmutase